MLQWEPVMDQGTRLQGRDIPILEAAPLLPAHVHLRGVWFRPTCVTLWNALLLEQECPINDIKLLRFNGSYRMGRYQKTCNILLPIIGGKSFQSALELGFLHD